jgi:hypothetical protein
VHILIDNPPDAGKPIFTFHRYMTDNRQGVQPDILCPNGRCVEGYVPGCEEKAQLTNMYCRHKNNPKHHFVLGSPEEVQQLLGRSFCESLYLFVTMLVSRNVQRCVGLC